MEYDYTENEEELQTYEEDFISSYEFRHLKTPTDGEHRELGYNGEPLGEGMYKNGELEKGIEFNWLIRVVAGELKYKPNCPEDPYDSSNDFEYEKMEQYGFNMLFSPFSMSENYIIDDGIEKYYVADLEVDDDMEHMIHIRTLEEFLLEKNPERLTYLKEMITLETEG